MNVLRAEIEINIPCSVKARLKGKSIEQQLEYFNLEYCHTTTCWLDDRKVKNPEKYHGEKRAFKEEDVILVQDGIVVGIDIGEKLYCFTNPCSSIHSYNGHRTTNDGWGYEEEHEWFIFRYIEDDADRNEQDRKEIQDRKAKLIRDAAYYRGMTFTLTKMTEYYGTKYSDMLDKANKGEPYAYCLLGQMFEESVHHAHEKRDYDYPPMGYREAAKAYYELAALSGYSRGAYYLGESYITDKDYKQAEKWLLIAAEQNVTDACYELGKVYHILWKQNGQSEYLEKARTWKQTALQINNSVSEWYDMADFYKDILINGKIGESGQKQELLSEMTKYYTIVAYSRADYLRKSVCEELVRIYMGDYGTVADIDKAFLYGDAAINKKSSYAAYRLGQYLVEHEPKEQEKIIYYLERAVDFPGSVDGSRELLQQYLEQYEVLQYLRTESLLLMEAGRFYDLGRIYHRAIVVEKSMQTALYYYTRAMEGIAVKEDMYTGDCYNLAYYFMLELQKEGISVAEEVWEELECRRKKEEFHDGFSEGVACVLADLNVRHHVIDMNAFQKQIKDIRFVFEIPEDKLYDFESDFYSRGMMSRQDQKYLQKYIRNLLAQMAETDAREQVTALYQDLAALAEYAAISTGAAGSVGWRMREHVGRMIADACLDRMLDDVLKNKIAQCCGQLEKDCRVQCYADFEKNWPNACKKVQAVYRDFLN